MPKKRFYSGVIDPVTIIGVLFLIITAGVGIYVVRNRNINLDINERASCSNTCLQSDFPELCGCTSDNIDDAPAGSGGISVQDEIDEYEEEQQQQNNTPVIQPTTPPTTGCNANGTIYQNNSVVVGGTSSSGYSKCVGNAWVPCPTCTITQLTTVPVYLQEQYNQAVEEAQQILQNQQLIEDAAPKPNDPDIQLSDNQQEQKDICLLDGGIWNSQSTSCNYTTPQQLKEQVQTIQNIRPRGETRCSGSMLETWNGSRWDQEYCSAGCNQNKCNPVVVQNNTINFGESGAVSINTKNPCPDGSTWMNNRCIIQQTLDISKTTASLSNLFELLGQKFESTTLNSGIANIGNYGLGGGNAYIAPVPMNIITSKDGNEINNYILGNTLSFGAGFTTAAAITTAPLAYQYAPQAINAVLNIKYVPQILTAADALDSTITGVACNLGNEEACSYFQASLFIPGFTSPNMFVDTFDDLGNAWSGTGAQFLDNITGSFDDLASALSNSGTQFTDDVTGALDNMAGLENTPDFGGWPTSFDQTPTQTDEIVAAIIPNSPNATLLNEANNGQYIMLFAPEYSNPFALSNFIPAETGGGINLNNVVDSIDNNLGTNSLGFGIADIDKPIQTIPIEEIIRHGDVDNLPDTSIPEAYTPLVTNPALDFFGNGIADTMIGFQNLTGINLSFGIINDVLIKQTDLPNGFNANNFQAGPNIFNTAINEPLQSTIVNIPRPIVDVFQNYLYSQTGGFLPFINNFLVPNRVLDLAIEPPPSPLQRVANWIDANTGNNPFFNFLFDRPSSIKPRPDETTLNIVVEPPTSVQNTIDETLSTIVENRSSGDFPTANSADLVDISNELDNTATLFDEITQNGPFTINPDNPFELSNKAGDKLFIGEELGHGTDSVVYTVKSENKVNGNFEIVAVEVIPNPKSRNTDQSTKNLTDKIELFNDIKNVLIRENRAELTRYIPQASAVTDGNGQLIGMLRTHVDGDTILSSGQISRQLTDTEINDLREIMRILDEYSIKISDLWPTNFGGSKQLVLFDIDPQLDFQRSHYVSSTNSAYDYEWAKNEGLITDYTSSTGERGQVYITDLYTNLENLNNLLRFLRFTDEVPPRPVWEEIYQALPQPANNTFIETVNNWWQRSVGDLNFRGLGNDQTAAPRSPDTNNVFDNIISWFDRVGQPKLTNQEITNVTSLTPDEDVAVPEGLLDNNIGQAKPRFTEIDSSISQDLPPIKITNTAIKDAINTNLPTAIKLSKNIGPTYPIVGVLVFGFTDYIAEEFFNIDLFEFNTTNESTIVGAEAKGVLEINKPTNWDIENIVKNLDKLNENEAVVEPVITDIYVKPAGLTSTGSGKCVRIDRSNPCDGERMYEMYLWYKNQTDGWWNKDGDFTPADFLALMLVAEAGGADPEFLKSITVATSSQLWGSSPEHEPYCKTASCEEGIFNFMGAYMEVASKRYNSFIHSPSQNIDQLLEVDESRYNYYLQNGFDIEKIANDTVHNPISTEYTNDTPTHWGNFGCGADCDYLGDNWLQNAGNNDIKVGTEDRCGLYDIYGQNGVMSVVYTNNQKYNWSLEDSPCFSN